MISYGNNVGCVVQTFTGLSCNQWQPRNPMFYYNAIDWANNLE
ncbi:hypothetical protein [endosymbiont of Lamellibrachia barhami]|nr:hypothetical protein [endosymbiont of Lamellibrachia barhami]